MRLAIPASLLLVLLLAGCASRPLPRYEKPLAKTEFQTVRTTAYTDTESDHIKYSNHNALGSTLQCGPVKSAAADWSRWPAGTVFRIVQTGEVYRVDDYGWALSGRNTIDLYKPSRHEMNYWGVRNVTIQILNWGDTNYSYEVLRPRSRYPHVKRMLREMENKPV
jgi:3D (Asp-Asp-Asp) domain-containing protein